MRGEMSLSFSPQGVQTASTQAAVTLSSDVSDRSAASCPPIGWNSAGECSIFEDVTLRYQAQEDSWPTINARTTFQRQLRSNPRVTTNASCTASNSGATSPASTAFPGKAKSANASTRVSPKTPGKCG